MIDCPRDQEPVPQDFLGHLRERLGIGEDVAVSTLADWISTYQPGPTALKRAVSLAQQHRRAA